MKNQITDITNFCRVFELPENYPNQFLFSGGVTVEFKMIDWFNPIPVADFPSWGGTLKSWSEYIGPLKEWLCKKIYLKKGKKYLLITDFNECFVFEKEEHGKDS